MNADTLNDIKVVQEAGGTATMKYGGVTYRLRHNITGVHNDERGLRLDVLVKGHVHTFTSWQDLIEYRIAVPDHEDSKSPTKVMSALEAACQAMGQAMTYGTGIIVRGEDGFYDTLDPSKYTIKEMIG